MALFDSFFVQKKSYNMNCALIDKSDQSAGYLLSFISCLSAEEIRCVFDDI